MFKNHPPEVVHCFRFWSKENVSNENDESQTPYTAAKFKMFNLVPCVAM